MRRTTNEAKLLAGTAQPCRMRKAEPPTVVGMPDIDLDVLTPRAREWLPRIAQPLIDQGTLGVGDGVSLIMLVESWAQFLEAGEVLEKSGIIYTTTTETGSVIHRPHPAVAMRAEAHRRWVTLSAKFGLSPADRLRVPVDAAPPEKVNPFDLI